MKKFILVLVGILVFACGSAFAQDAPKAEVFGGFSILSLGDMGSERYNPLGFQASVAGNINDKFGIVGDFGAQYKDGGHAYEYMGGPRLTARMEAASIFAHALFGGITIGGDGENYTDFAMGFGGGIDLNVSERFAVRAIQFDWIPVISDGEFYTNQVRFGFGIVIK